MRPEDEHYDLTPEEWLAIDRIQAELIGHTEDEQTSVLASVFAQWGVSVPLSDSAYFHITGERTMPLTPEDDSGMALN